jgi:hypothetical protein
MRLATLSHCLMNDDYWATARMDRFAGLVNEEFHAIEFLQEVVGKLDIGLVDLVDQQYRPFVGDERLPQLAALDVIADVLDPAIAQLAVAQPGDGIIFVKTLKCFGRGFDVPLDQWGAECLGDLERQDGFAGPRFPLHQQGALERDCGVNRNL